jgi:hypothetical protein
VKKEQSKEIITSTAIILTYGADPKELDIPVPSIPLEVALNKDRLSTYIEPHHKVVVFGTRHSGIYVLKNLVDCSVNSIVGIHKEKEPFLFARDNNYDGIKLGGATIADAILKGSYPSIRLVQTSNLSTILREVRSADWVVYAIGFQPRHTLKITKDSIEQSLAYDLSGSIINCPSTWGFGIAYPSQAPDGIHWDIGVSSFLEHIHRQISSINRVE